MACHQARRCYGSNDGAVATSIRCPFRVGDHPDCFFSDQEALEEKKDEVLRCACAACDRTLPISGEDSASKQHSDGGDAAIHDTHCRAKSLRRHAWAAWATSR